MDTSTFISPEQLHKGVASILQEVVMIINLILMITTMATVRCWFLAIIVIIVMMMIIILTTIIIMTIMMIRCETVHQRPATVRCLYLASGNSKRLKRVELR